MARKSVPVSSLLDEARASVGAKGPRGDVERLVAQLERDDPALLAEFVAAINDHDLPAAGLARALAKHGYPIAEQTIGRFRRAGRTL
jgi:hypothetical protein